MARTQPGAQKEVDNNLLSAETIQAIDHWVAKFPVEKKRSALIQSLMAAQHQNGGWLSRELIEAVAAYLDLPPVWAHEVATFYSMFDLQPVGRHKVNICTNISCWLNGADNVVKRIENKLGIRMGETTADRRITLIREEECLAACIGAPMMVVDGHYHEKLDEQSIDAILDGLD
ncbi:MAG: NADH-quinone oxidoreductase subunit NuoE [Xanthomonadales bacterium]|nr:NADH-quinone oxidoreductase subunit NuoE [Xanthomonadales bacterium]